MKHRKMNIRDESHEKIMAEWGRRRTFEENVTALIDDVLDRSGATRPALCETPADTVRSENYVYIDKDDIPPLEYSKACFLIADGRVIPVSRWKDAVTEMLRLAYARSATTEELRNVIGLSVVSGRRKTNRYRFIQDLNISFQVKTTQACVRHIMLIAKHYEIACEVHLTRMEDGHESVHVIRVP